MNYSKSILTNGCFSLGALFHHAKLLEYAASFKLDLFVGINSDVSIKKLKPGKIFLPQEERKYLLERMKDVYHVFIFNDEDELLNYIKILRPQILLKGEDYKGKEITGQKYVEKVEYFPFIEGHSTTNHIQKIQEPLIKSFLESEKEVSMNEKLNDVHGGYIDNAKNLIYPKWPRY